MHNPKVAFIRLINILIGLCFVAYPFVLFWKRDGLDSKYIALLMMVLWCLRGLFATQKEQRISAFVIALFFLMVACLGNGYGLYWYPVLASSLGLVIFAGSLFTKQSIIERIARWREPDLPPEGVRYTRKVTQLWVGYFLFNIAITIYYIWQQNWQMWTLYTGVISYILIGLIFAGEWCYRRWVLKR